MKRFLEKTKNRMAHYQQKKDETERRTAPGMKTRERERGRQVETNESPEILGRWKTSDIPRLPLGHIVKVKKRDQHVTAIL